MITTTIFVLSGVGIVVMLFVKMKALKTRKQTLLLGLISLGDYRVRNVYQKMTHHYSEVKEKGRVLVTKQLPMHSKNLLNKAEILVKDKSEKYLSNIRNSRLLNNRKEGLSEFFKNLSDKENGDSQKDRDLIE
ncbi:MAG: hypothetical protein ACYC1K_00680 [Minisyncoccota bacterium]